MTSANWKELFACDTVYSADSVEWCTVEPYLAYFVCGTYLLLDEDNASKNVQKRIGRLLLMKITKECLAEVHSIETFGILDTKWFPRELNAEVLLASANAVGDIVVYNLNNDKLNEKARMSLKTVEEGDYMTLSINWFSGQINDKAMLCVTDNRGNAAVLEYCVKELVIIEKWNAHSLEAWTGAFDGNDFNLLYTGGDDAKLRIWDRRCGTGSPKAIVTKQDTGVTIITTETGLDNVLVSGSFDEILLMWDKRKMKTPQSEIRCSGGLWRVKCKDKFVLTANIYGGFQIIDVAGHPKVVADYKNHSSLAYGADWSNLNYSTLFNDSNCKVLVGTCSFYDHKLTVSEWDSKKELI